MHKNYLAVRDPARGAYSTPPDLIAGGEGDSCPSLRTPPTLELPPYGPRLASHFAPPNPHDRLTQLVFCTCMQ